MLHNNVDSCCSFKITIIMLILNAMLLSEKLMISNCIFDVNYAFINLFDSSICSTLKFAVQNFRCKLGCYTEVNLKFFFSYFDCSIDQDTIPQKQFLQTLSDKIFLIWAEKNWNLEITMTIRSISFKTKIPPVHWFGLLY